MNARIEAIQRALEKAGKAGEALNREKAEAQRTRNAAGLREFMSEYAARMKRTTDTARAEINEAADALRGEINAAAAFNLDRVNERALAFLQTQPDAGELQSMAQTFRESPEMLQAIKRHAEGRKILSLNYPPMPAEKAAALETIHRNATQIIDRMTDPNEAKAETYAGHAANAAMLFEGAPFREAAALFDTETE